jgi:hypothetical protein
VKSEKFATAVPFAGMAVANFSLFTIHSSLFAFPLLFICKETLPKKVLPEKFILETKKGNQAP